MTPHRTKPRELERLGRALRTLSAANRALLRADDEPTLLHEICRVIVEVAGYRAAMVVRAEHDEARSITTLAQLGFEQGQGEFKSLTWADSEEGHSATGTAIRTGEPWVVNDVRQDSFPSFWREFSVRQGIGSLLSLPLRVDGQVTGALTIGAPEPDAFDEEERMPLEDAAEDLAFGMATLRMRARAAAAEETIRRMAYQDAATGLANRVRLREQLAEDIAVAKDERRPVALLRIELERLREINEALGDQQADAFVTAAAQRLAQVPGVERERLARLAEGEFGLVLPRAGAEVATQLAQRVLLALAEPMDVSGLLLDSRSAVGISLFPGHGTDADSLMRRAGIALGQARRAGSSVSLFRGGLDTECAQRIALMGDLRGAIERNELQLYCQPKLNMVTGALCGAEALVRWEHPRQGLINPGDFIRLAESTGLITPLTYWVLDAALRQCYAWREHGMHQPLSVNLSVRDLRDPRLLDRIGGALATWGAQPGWIDFELTESALMEDPAGALETLNRLKRLNVSLTIDDYGTGYSSLSYLRQLPVDSIKIDRSFVTDMTRNKDAATIVRSTIELAHNLDLSVIAEGVEDQPTFDRLAALGCDMAQGYCISRPIPVEEFRHWQAPGHRH
ncbi:putative bifunctional diguanylate cyclase/phosphodiesterase [Ideonella sp. YS5]|uniref:putative bifunctional diguanylate cyclase/phosphodiesterase n=1 Tax=Ideonella sp. YS5 TaxID=3453714 RepID=UPI003EEE6987